MTKPVLTGLAIAVAAALALFVFWPAQDTAQQSAETSPLPAAELPTEIVTPVAGFTDFQPDVPRHGSSLFGELKYAPDFTHFDYVNPTAPKGGLLRYAVFGSFDSLNNFVVRSEAVAGIGFIYDTLMTQSFDEAASEYGLLAESVRHPADYSSATYVLRQDARWHDGEPVTPADVIWTIETLKAQHPFYTAYYANVIAAEQTGPREVTFRFNQTGNRELPQIVGQFPVLPKHYWTGTDAKGRPRDISLTTLEPPLGSGPYRVGTVAPGQHITYERVEDYWGRDLPVNVGANNFDRIRFTYFRDTTVAFEAFKGGQIDLRIENSARNWATEYDIPAVRRGDIKRDSLPSLNPQGMQSFAFNLRRDKFKDIRVRRAFNYAFDYEWVNKTLFHGQYTRSGSYFANSEMAATGVPDGRELEILETVRALVPPEVFTETYANPATDGSGNNRANLRRATELFAEAGWVVKDGKLIHTASGEQMSVEFLIDDPTFERVVAPYRQSLERLGMVVRIRPVDSAQYQRRTDERNFDIIVRSFGQSISPGNEQREYWGCAAAEQEGSRNVIGICDPAIEKLVDRVIFAENRTELVAAVKALDRVLLHGHYVVPQWYLATTRVAYWSRLRHPERMPPYSIGFPAIWWHEGAEAADETP
ncbi:MAG: extracellular solute-binding protein [Parvibaculum sp.]|uniref:extracellular solute-binding protein n=1 Tax=Parvibaculum sp. TaxID=2024848 RepID=UPI002726D769|nr:extracellular solute-binding protein [Parvibaculum sp.]MDO8839141.1 extracellular solute-binding protein [Parvibaculum sp.]